MTEPTPQSPNNDPLWQQFHAAEAQSDVALEVRYQEIEGFNAHILNLVAGIQDSEFKLQGVLGDKPEDPDNPMPETLVLKQTHENFLFLQPDRRDELHQQGEDAFLGDPYVIRGDVSPRTQKLIEDMFTSTEATLDKEHSTPTIEIWRGNVAGTPIHFEKRNQMYRLHGLEGVAKDMPSLSIGVYRGKPKSSEGIAQAAVEGAIQSDTSFSDEQLDSLQTTVQHAADEALQSTKRRLDKPGWLGRIFGKKSR